MFFYCHSKECSLLTQRPCSHWLVGLVLMIGIAGTCVFPASNTNAGDEPVLRLPPSEHNPRNSEGDFVQLKNGSWVFIYTKFSGGSSDHDAADLVSRSSNDDGATWSSDDRVVLANEGHWNVMSVSMLRLADGRIAFFYLRKQSLSDCRPLVRFSSDEMETWSDPIEIIPPEKNGYYVLNNDRVVQLSGDRIIVPVALHSHADPTQPNQLVTDWVGRVTSFHSDDSGQSWQQSKTIREAFLGSNPSKRISAHEPGVVELRDGRLLMWIRTDAGHQYESTSDDRGETWSEFKPMQLASPLSPASIERIPSTGDLLAVWNDHAHLPVEQRKLRTPLSYAISQDEGATWSESQSIADDPQGWYCYTAIDFANNHVLLAHVAGSQQPKQHLATTTLERLELDAMYRRVGLAYQAHRQ